MVEIGVMVVQCLDRRIPTKAMIIKEVKAWERARNRDKARIKWLFTVERAREKLGPRRAGWLRCLATGPSSCPLTVWSPP
jgi:hypothetical protein